MFGRPAVQPGARSGDRAPTRLPDGPAERERPEVETVPEQWYVLVTCRDEKQQVDLLGRLSGEGLECRALLS